MAEGKGITIWQPGVCCCPTEPPPGFVIAEKYSGATSSLVWRFRRESGVFDSALRVPAGRAIAANGDGDVFVGGDSDVNGHVGWLLNSSGAVQWTLSLGGGYLFVRAAAYSVDEDYIYISYQGSGGNRLAKLAAADGSSQWDVVAHSTAFITKLVEYAGDVYCVLEGTTANARRYDGSDGSNVWSSLTSTMVANAPSVMTGLAIDLSSGDLYWGTVGQSPIQGDRPFLFHSDDDGNILSTHPADVTDLDPDTVNFTASARDIAVLSDGSLAIVGTNLRQKSSDSPRYFVSRWTRSAASFPISGDEAYTLSWGDGTSSHFGQKCSRDGSNNVFLTQSAVSIGNEMFGYSSSGSQLYAIRWGEGPPEDNVRAVSAGGGNVHYAGDPFET